jgi:hypothetical protein
MRAPTYNWVCKKCTTSNDAGSAFCVGCGGAAAEAPTEVVSRDQQETQPPLFHDGDFWASIIPEGYIAIAALISTPFVLMALLLSGEFFRAFVWIGGMGSMGCLMVYAFREGLRFLAYISIFGVLLTVLLVIHMSQ